MIDVNGFVSRLLRRFLASAALAGALACLAPALHAEIIGGNPGPESDWIAISSFYFVGLTQRMMLPEGRTAEALQFDLRALWTRQPDAMPAGCMMLFKIR